MIRLGLGFVALALLPTIAFAWGESAQRLIANKALETLPPEMQPFFQANSGFFAQHIADADEIQPRNPAEQRNDLLQLDHYGQFPFSALPRDYKAALAKYGRRTLDKYGLLPWEIGLYSQKLTDALSAHDWNSARIAAAILAHYVASAHDPFRTTVNSEGQVSDQAGVDVRFGTDLVNRYQMLFFIRPNEATLVHDPTNYAFDMALAAHAWLENILLADQRAHSASGNFSDVYYDRFYARAGAILIRQLSDSATDVGSYWMTAWVNAGRPQLPAR